MADAALADLLQRAHKASKENANFRAAELYGRAVAAAQQLQHKDCLIVALLQCLQAAMLGSHAKALRRAGEQAASHAVHFHEWAPLVVAAAATAQRRHAAGTLLAAPRPHEIQFYQQEEEAKSRSDGITGGITQQGPFIGYELLYLTAAQCVKALLTHHPHMGIAARLPAHVSHNELVSHVVCAIHTMMKPLPALDAPVYPTSEAQLVLHLRDEAFCGGACQLDCRTAHGARLQRAWLRLQRSGFLETPIFCRSAVAGERL
jgi:hypothetical protein